MPANTESNGNRSGRWSDVLMTALGLWLALVMVKFGNPVIFEVESPNNVWESILGAWPFAWGILLCLGIFALALTRCSWKCGAPRWILALPLIWFGWQLLSASRTVDAGLTRLTLIHFAACLACFFVGLFRLRNIQDFSRLWLGMLIGFGVILLTGLDQHFGGLERTRQAFETMDRSQLPAALQAQLETPEFQKKIASNRIFSTFVYPNALAGAILLYLPPCLAGWWDLSRRMPLLLRALFGAVMGISAMACMFWSESKAGWLILLSAGLVLLFKLPIGNRLKWIGLALILTAGMAGFLFKFSGYLSRGATSVVARTDYWRTAVQMMKERPVLGWGPGTFKVPYAKLKRPESEMAKLAHNDYLQQGTDSGLVGLLAYSVFIFASLFCLRYRGSLAAEGWKSFSCWLGVSGLAVQSLVEFGLYIPALAWPMFLFLGWLWSGWPGRIPIDSAAAVR